MEGEKRNSLINVLLLATMLLLGIFICNRNTRTQELIDGIETIDSTNTYSKVYYESKINSLKEKNKELYDSLKECRNQITNLIQFKYEKEYETGKIEIKQETPSDPASCNVETDSTYVYENGKNDTVMYRLQVNSKREPNWYSLKMKFSDKFTIVNKAGEDGLNVITVKPDNGGDISNVTVFKKKETKGLFKRFKIGPAVTAGYDPINKQWGTTVGIGVMFDITK